MIRASRPGPGTTGGGDPMPDAVIVSTARTAIGTSFKGSLLDVDAYELGTLAVAEAVRRSGIDPELVDDVILGEILYGGGDIARYAAIEAGMVHAPGVAHNRHCASGLSAVQGGAASIRSGMDTGGSGRRGPLELDLAAHHAAGARRRRLGGVERPQPPGHARRPQPRHVDHRGVERRRQGRRDP